MKFLNEQDIPKTVKLSPPPTKEDPMARIPDILQDLLDVLRRGRDMQTIVDTTPIADALRVIERLRVQPKAAPVKSWTFTFYRDKHGVLQEVTVTKQT